MILVERYLELGLRLGRHADELVDSGPRALVAPACGPVEKMVESLRERTSAGYVFCYPEGLRLARGFVRGDAARFRRLIVEQLTPADLEGQAA